MKTVRTRPEKTVAHEPVIAMNRRFGAYAPEEVHIVRKPEVKRDRAVEELKGLYRKTKVTATEIEYVAYNRMANSFKNHSYSAADIERFSIAIAEFQEEEGFAWKAGIVLTALINNGKEKDYVVQARHLDIPMDNLGYTNTKNITVKGNVGDRIGTHMKGGTITVKGNAGQDVGCHTKGGAIIVEGDAGNCVGGVMMGGTITVKGNAGRVVGSEMNGGSITVKRNAGDDCGKGLKGGEIHIEGEIGSIGNVIHGKIYHKGKLIVDK